MRLKTLIAIAGGILTIWAFIQLVIPAYNMAVELPVHYEESEKRITFLEWRDTWKQCVEDCLRAGNTEAFCIDHCKRYVK